ncbi:Uncharacterised protein [BD1-7 clade bacterium]|uniref:Uncharacterized protein n=1 Tax=BD1-7 clade bacterium TaxID=2029982 RepID=A0A5S9P849_9GAMM|nr:Uncharacterised protein [BD1-7 clade bacterium]CAA0099719.1 Uncharacterised protein [BD1-7 clade bacterium]
MIFYSATLAASFNKVMLHCTNQLALDSLSAAVILTQFIGITFLWKIAVKLIIS